MFTIPPPAPPTAEEELVLARDRFRRFMVVFSHMRAETASLYATAGMHLIEGLSFAVARGDVVGWEASHPWEKVPPSYRLQAKAAVPHMKIWMTLERMLSFHPPAAVKDDPTALDGTGGALRGWIAPVARSTQAGSGAPLVTASALKHVDGTPDLLWALNRMIRNASLLLTAPQVPVTKGTHALMTTALSLARWGDVYVAGIRDVDPLNAHPLCACLADMEHGACYLAQRISVGKHTTDIILPLTTQLLLALASWGWKGLGFASSQRLFILRGGAGWEVVRDRPLVPARPGGLESRSVWRLSRESVDVHRAPQYPPGIIERAWAPWAHVSGQAEGTELPSGFEAPPSGFGGTGEVIPFGTPGAVHTGMQMAPVYTAPDNPFG